MMALTKEEALAIIRRAQEDGDVEAAHAEADDALCGFLEHLGHGDLVAEWHRVEKRYA